MERKQIEDLIARYGLKGPLAQELESLSRVDGSAILDSISLSALLGASVRLDDTKDLPAPFDSEQTICEAMERTTVDPTGVVGHARAGSAAGPHDPKGGMGKYGDLGLIGKGGMGVVHRVFDRRLSRRLAMKILYHGGPVADEDEVRFVEEAQVCAQLQHPNIVPVHELGQLEDGRLYFTMKEIHGDTLKEVIRSCRRVSGDNPPDWSLRRMVEAFHRVCETIAYAHSKGVIHRDLKPSNIMLGQFGEVMVLDWGIAKVKGRSDADGVVEAVVSDRVTDGEHLTEAGAIAGTPAYMAPEQARGEIDAIDARTDVYALGAILYEILSGRAPYSGRTFIAIIEKVLTKPPVSIWEASSTTAKGQAPFGNAEPLGLEPGGQALPEELVGICEKAMHREPASRYSGAERLAKAVRGWLDGAKKREEALSLVLQARRKAGERDVLLERASSLRSAASSELEEVSTWQSEDDKVLGWEKEDQARESFRLAERALLEQERLLHAALSHKADLPEAHVDLAAMYRNTHQEAEFNRDAIGAARAEFRLRQHVAGLPPKSELRDSHFAYLKGDGVLSLFTDPAGAEVYIESYSINRRKLVPGRPAYFGTTPLRELPIAMGSYRLRIRKRGCREVLYPVEIGRLEDWSGRRPGGSEAIPLPLPPEGRLPAETCLVPAGWFWCGGDSKALKSMPKTRVWLDSFAIQRFPVSNRDYIAFLDALAADGREEEALRCAPQISEGLERALLYGRTEMGGFKLVPDAQGMLWDLDWPVISVDFASAGAYASWLSSSTGHAWRLPTELEWEKAARGADGRAFPWGDAFEHSWACCWEGQEKPLLAPVDSFPFDESPYGVRGMAGNSIDWTSTLFREEGPRIEGGLAHEPEGAGGTRVCRGGSWCFYERSLRSASRDSNPPEARNSALGIRLCLGLPSKADRSV
jgi:eukaryotic-like serine/threonine-protein kinase